MSMQLVSLHTQNPTEMAGSEEQRREWKEFKESLRAYKIDLRNDYEYVIVETIDGKTVRSRKKET